ncbi:hypothetical protein CPC08DRAFT_622521, partial [Agrocybe pediades]
DGSGYQGKVGAAAIIYTDGAQQPTGTLRYHLGPAEEHSTYEGEAVGLILAAWLLRAHCGQRVGSTAVSVYSDCQSVIKSVLAMRPGPGQHLLTAHQGEITPKFTLHWISAHTNVPGNEKVDEEAKAAAQGSTTPKPFLPPVLQRPMP